MSGMSEIGACTVKKSSGPKIEPCGTPQESKWV